jgi:hypothetical protein
MRACVCARTRVRVWCVCDVRACVRVYASVCVSSRAHRYATLDPVRKPPTPGRTGVPILVVTNKRRIASQSALLHGAVPVVLRPDVDSSPETLLKAVSAPPLSTCALARVRRDPPDRTGPAAQPCDEGGSLGTV